MKNQNLPVVEAKEEYTNVLKNAMCDVIYSKIISLYDECVRETNTNEPILVRYMKKLKDVLDWSPAYIDVHLNKIKRNCSWFDELLTAVIVTNVKILTSVKLNKTKKKVQLKMPSSEKFLHQVFIDMAKRLYINIQKNKYFKSNDENSMNLLIFQSIDDVIRKQIPIQNILQTYMTNIDSSDDEEHDEPDEPEEETEIPDEEPEIPDEEPEIPDEEPDEEEPPEMPDEEIPEPCDERMKDPRVDLPFTDDNQITAKSSNFFDPPQVKNIPVSLQETKKPYKPQMVPDAAPDPED